MRSRDVVRAAIGFILYVLGVPVVLFVAAGTLNWPMAWVYVALFWLSTLGSRLIVLRRNPDTLRERARFTASEGTPAWDRVLSLTVGLVGPLAMTIVAGLDHRFGWSRSIADGWQVLATVVVAYGYGMAVWAMVANPYFGAVARIQEDRGHRVVTNGPYRVVRHPSYAGALLAALDFPFMLEALWALIPALLMIVALVVRTALEDRMLRRELDGYKEYAEQIRYRLIPGIW